MNPYELSLQRSWHDPAWNNNLNSNTILTYFSERSNPFYDHQSNNEILKMQHIGPEKLFGMTGVEYVLAHAQEPILFVIRQQNRKSPTEVTPMADFYIIAGTVYQSPDLTTIISSRLLNAAHSLGSAFEETQSYSRYHPSRDYWWHFKDQSLNQDKDKKKQNLTKTHTGTYFQRERVDLLLRNFEQQFSVKKEIDKNAGDEMKVEGVKMEVKVEAGVDRKGKDKEVK